MLAQLARHLGKLVPPEARSARGSSILESRSNTDPITHSGLDCAAIFKFTSHPGVRKGNR